MDGNSETQDQRPSARARTPDQRREQDEKAQAAEQTYIRKIDHFQLVDLLGTGGMGEVYRAYDERLDRLVALKIVRLDRPHDKKSGGSNSDEMRKQERRRIRVRRFIDEAQLAARLDHPNIVPIYELGDAPEDSVYFAMKLVEGVTLSQIIKKAGPERLDPAHLSEYLQIFIKVCEALAFAHSRGMVHRDIKPSNIMVGPFGQVYLMDWGAGLLLGSDDALPKQRLEVSREGSVFGTVVGTLQYMPPEQAKGHRTRVDARSDVFSLGATLYHMATGRAPYSAREVVKLLALAQAGHYTPPDVVVGGGQIPHRLVEIIMRAMALDPEDRYQSVSSLQADLEDFLHGSWHPLKKYAPGSRIVTEGEEAHAAYIIEKGRCAVVDLNGPQRVVLRELGPGEVFGETAVFSQARRTATVEAINDVVVTVVTREALDGDLARSSSLGKFIKTLAERFEEVDHRLRETRQAAMRLSDI